MKEVVFQTATGLITVAVFLVVAFVVTELAVQYLMDDEEDHG